MAAAAMKATVAWILRLLLGGVFIFAAIGKLSDPSRFVSDIAHYRLLPYPLALGLALYLPWLELVCAIALLGRWRERAATLMILTLCVLFSSALASAWLRRLDITCGCFGHDRATSVPWALARSLGLAFVAIYLLRSADPVEKPKGDSAPQP